MPAPPLRRASSFLLSLAGVPEGHGGRALRLVTLVFAMSLALVLMKSAQSGIFLGAYPKAMIPWVFAASAVALATLSAVTVTLAARLGPARLAMWTLGLVALSLPVLCGVLTMARAGAPFVAYVLIEAASGLLLIQVWSVVSEACDARSARRLMPVAGVGGGLAWTIGGLLCPPLVTRVGTLGLLLLAAVLLLAAIASVRAIVHHDLHDRAERGLGRVGLLAGWRDGFTFLVRARLLRWMAVLAVLALVVEQVMDFALMTTVRDAYVDPPRIAAFFGTYYGVTSALTLVLLAGPAGRVLSGLGASRALLLTPLLTACAALAAAAFPSVAALVLLRGVDRVLKQTVWSSASEQMQQPLPATRRTQARAAIRGVLAPGVYALAALGLTLLPEHVDERLAALVTAVLAAAMCLVAARWVPRAYLGALTRAIDARRISLEPLAPRPALDPRSLPALEADLADDGARAELAAEALSLLHTPTAPALLARGLEHPSALVRARSAHGLGEQTPHADTTRALDARLGAEPDAHVRLAIVDALRHHDDDTARAALHRAQSDDDPDVAHLAAIATAEDPSVTARFVPLLASTSDSARRAALSALSRDASTQPGVTDALRALLASRTASVRLDAAETIVRLRLLPLLPDVVLLLRDARLAPRVARTLVALADDLENAPAREGSASTSQIARHVADLTEQTAASLVNQLLAHGDPTIRAAAARALASQLRAGRRAPLPPSFVQPLLDRELASAYTLWSILGGIARDDGVPDWEVEEPFRFLAGEVELRLELVKNRVLTLLVLLGNGRIVSAVEAARRSPSERRDAQAAELLEQALDRRTAARIVPLFERLSLRERALAARSLGLLAEAALNDPLDAIVHAGDAHVRRAALLVYGERFSARFPVTDDDRAMLPLYERMRFLRSVHMFASLPGEDLVHVAQSVEELAIAPGALVFDKGDHGEDLFLVADGRVEIVDGAQLVATLGPGEFFGDLAVLDHQPRMAAARAASACTLLRLRGADLDELLAERPQIAREIALVLARRLRAVRAR